MPLAIASWCELSRPQGPVEGAARVERVESTPNPNAFKLICDGRLYDGTRNYATAADAAGHELAEKVFAIEGVDTVFLCDHFMTVSVKPGTDLTTVETQARAIIESTPSPLGAAIPPPGAPTGGFDPASLADDQREIYERINGLLDERVRPALAGDGGGLEVVGLEGKTLLIRYQVACGSCPSSIAGTLMAIQNLLQQEVVEELSVVSS